MGKLYDRMEQDLILKGLAATTRRNYLLYCHKFAAHLGRSPEELCEFEVRPFLPVTASPLNEAATRQS